MVDKGVFLGWLIIEPATMSIGSTLLEKSNPLKNLRYATIGLLHINVLISGTLYILALQILTGAYKSSFSLSFTLSLSSNKLSSSTSENKKSFS